MTMEIRFHGQSTFEISEGDARVLTDPFLEHSPVATVGPGDIDPTDILVTHGHADHIADVVPIASRTGASVAAIVEQAGEFAGALGEDHPVHDPNLGGSIEYPWGWAKWVQALHTSTSPSGTVSVPAGIVINIGGRTIYHLGDTSLFSDLALVGRRTPIDIALVCIGGHYTMDRHDAVEAVKLIGAQTIIPCHYNTFPAIQADAQAFKADVERETDAQVVVLEPGETYTP
jgi:L-ascorbate metabolism protein UlaG (beta-lactamase superfamily)